MSLSFACASREHGVDPYCYLACRNPGHLIEAQLGAPHSGRTGTMHYCMPLLGQHLLQEKLSLSVT